MKKLVHRKNWGPIMNSPRSTPYSAFTLATTLLVSTVLISGSVLASSTGIRGNSGKSAGFNCSDCHTGRDYQSTLTFLNETTFEPGSLNNLSLALNFTTPPGVTNAHAGVNIAISDGGGQLIAGDTTRMSEDELVHPTPQSANSGSFTWEFQWQAPDEEGEVILYACSLAVDRNFGTSNDERDVACLTQTFTVANPTPPDDTPDESDDTPDDPPEDPVTTNSPLGDVDDDGRADLAVWRASNQTFYTKSTATDNLVHRAVLGQSSDDEPLMGDIDGNGITDLATWDPASGIWNVLMDDGSTQTFTLGESGDYPFLLDRDGDGRDDPMVRRPSEGSWYFLASSEGYAENRIVYGARETDVPVPGYYDTDDIVDLAIWRDGTWYMRWSSDNVSRTQDLGTQSTDIMAPADYDGDGITDVGMWRPSTGTWYIYYSTGEHPDGASRFVRAFGNQSTDIPVPADYDGDGKADLAVRRPTSGEFIYLSSETGDIVRFSFGREADDVPVLGAWQIRDAMLNPASEDDDSGSDDDGESDARKDTGDVDGDGRSDFIIWTPDNQTMQVLSAGDESELLNEALGTNNTDVPLVGNLNDNELADFASWNAASGTWSVRYDDGSAATFTLGQDGDVPFLLDRDGDGLDDFTVRRPSEGTWYFLASASNYEVQSVAYGRLASDFPVPGYYDTDDIVDFAIWRDGTWYMRWSSDDVTRTQPLGTQSTDIMTPADYDGDGITDVAIWRPSTGTWYIYYSTGVYPDGGSRFERVFGKESTDLPAPADYDGDGKADLGIYRPTSQEFMYLSSASGSVVRVAQGSSSEDIPVQAAWKVKEPLVQTTANDDGSGDGDGNGDGDGSNDEAAQYYSDNVSENIVQNRCVACHVSGGAADGLARLTFVTSATENYQAINQQAFEDFLALDDVTADYILSKASGGSGHVGGAQLPVGGDNYNTLSTWLGLVTGSDVGTGIDDDYWEGVSLLTPEQTLRRASIIMTGKMPSEEATNALGSGSDAELQTALLTLMEGDEFHEFLTRGVNDRLLTDKWVTNGFFDAVVDSTPFFPEVARIGYESDNFYGEFYLGFLYGAARAPIELVAYIVENDLPYTEILTADYTMLNRFTDQGYAGTAEFSGDELVNEFKPGRKTGIMLLDESFYGEWDENGLNIINEGPRVDWPHAGILSDLSWLGRYPSTATNRNRARSRWTYYHFLDFDIENSVARTQDPEALADTNNPTLNNPNCTACHQTLDPIAGAYQLFGDTGHYREMWGGMDSLPYTYKESEDSPYVEGDTWYRTMLAPGFEGTDAPMDQDSLQWLSQQITADQRFATASVKFWWHTIMGYAPVLEPNDANLPSYEVDLATHAAQSLFFTEAAENLSSHWNMKRTFADLMMSPWFRAISSGSNELHQSVGTERLLTPEELDKKTYGLTGSSWIRYTNDNEESNLFGTVSSALNNRYRYVYDDYGIMYGGIDSDGITNRSEEMTSVMSQVALAHAYEMACPVVVHDFAKDNEERLLFDGILRNVDIFAIASETHEITGKWSENTMSYNISIDSGAEDLWLSLRYENPFQDHENGHSINLHIDHISIMNNEGLAVLDINGADFFELTNVDGCGHKEWNPADSDFPSDALIYRNCKLTVPVEIETAGEYTISVDAFYQEWKPDDLEDGPAPELTISIGTPNPLSKNTQGLQLVKNKIVQLHARLFGETVALDSEEVDLVTELFTNSISAKLQRTDYFDIREDDLSCFVDSYVYDDPDTDEWEGDWVFEDPELNLSGWRAVIAYMLSDYRYLHE